jgi:hypothetical protein
MVSTQLQRNSSDTFGQTSFLVITATRTVGSEIVKQASIKNTSSSCIVILLIMMIELVNIIELRQLLDFIMKCLKLMMHYSKGMQS